MTPALISAQRLLLRRLRKGLEAIRCEEAVNCNRFAESGVFWMVERKRGKKKSYVVKLRYALSQPPVTVATFRYEEAAYYFLWAVAYAKPLLYLGTMFLRWTTAGTLTPEQEKYLKEWEISHAGGWQRESKKLKKRSR